MEQLYLKLVIFLINFTFFSFFLLFFRRKKMEMDIQFYLSHSLQYLCISLHGVLNIYLTRSIIKIYRNNGMIEGILIGLKTALSFQNLMMVMIGCFCWNYNRNASWSWPNDCNCFNDTNYLRF